MIPSYNSRLQPVEDKGLCGDPEVFDDRNVLSEKVKHLVKLIKRSEHTVVFTGAGISTSSGIADFRGPKGVWTQELNGIPVDSTLDTAECFEKAVPSYTHNALASLLNSNHVHHIISQNVDGLHLRSGVSTEHLTELHGNIFIETCVKCKMNYFRDHDVGGMGLKPTGKRCDNTSCNGALIDNAIDWDTPLPEEQFKRAENHLKQADLVLCLGTSLRIRPAGNLPRRVLKATPERRNRTGHIAIVNLQKTHLDKVSTVRISYYCDDVMRRVCRRLGVVVQHASADAAGGDNDNDGNGGSSDSDSASDSSSSSSGGSGAQDSKGNLHTGIVSYNKRGRGQTITAEAFKTSTTKPKRQKKSTPPAVAINAFIIQNKGAKDNNSSSSRSVRSQGKVQSTSTTGRKTTFTTTKPTATRNHEVSSAAKVTVSVGDNKFRVRNNNNSSSAKKQPPLFRKREEMDDPDLYW